MEQYALFWNLVTVFKIFVTISCDYRNIDCAIDMVEI